MLIASTYPAPEGGMEDLEGDAYIEEIVPEYRVEMKVFFVRTLFTTVNKQFHRLVENDVSGLLPG
jgi:hypothetical protein